MLRPLFGYVLALAILVGAGAQARAADEYQAAHTIAVVSGLESRIAVQEPPSLGHLLGETHLVPLGWNVSDYAMDVTGKLLSGRFTIVPSPAETSIFLDDMHWGRDSARKVSQISSRSSAQTPDLYVVLYPLFMGGTNTSIKLDYSGGSAFRGPSTVLATLLFVAVIDGRTGERLDTGSSHDPLAVCDRSLWPNPIDHFDDVQKTKLESALKNLLEDNLLTAFNHAGLISDSAADGALQQLKDQSKSLTCQVP